jgi:hypothetical protein
MFFLSLVAAVHSSLYPCYNYLHYDSFWPPQGLERLDDTTHNSKKYCSSNTALIIYFEYTDRRRLRLQTSETTLFYWSIRLTRTRSIAGDNAFGQTPNSISEYLDSRIRRTSLVSTTIRSPSRYLPLGVDWRHFFFGG